MDSPKVSLVICTYNQQNFVRETVESALAQTYPYLEIIVSDDGSSDDTPRILTEYAQRFPEKVKVVLNVINTGIPSNINRGLAARTGALTAWLDGDDVMLPEKIEKQVRLLHGYPEAIGCYHDAEVFESDTGKSLGSFCQLYNGTPKLNQGTLQTCLKPRYYGIPSSIMCWSTACPARGYDERLKQLSELLFFVEVFRTGKILALDERLVRYRRHSGNLTSDANARKTSYEYELMVYSILEARYPELHPLLRKLRLSCMLVEATRSYRESDIQRFRIIVRNAIVDGALLQGLSVLAVTTLAGQWFSRLTSGQPYYRPAWIKRLSRRFFE